VGSPMLSTARILTQVLPKGDNGFATDLTGLVLSKKARLLPAFRWTKEQPKGKVMARAILPAIPQRPLACWRRRHCMRGQLALLLLSKIDFKTAGPWMTIQPVKNA